MYTAELYVICSKQHLKEQYVISCLTQHLREQYVICPTQHLKVYIQNMYSLTCLQRPPKVNLGSGLLTEVVSEYSLTCQTSWSLLMQHISICQYMHVYLALLCTLYIQIYVECLFL